MHNRNKKLVCTLVALLLAAWLGSIFHQAICAHRLQRLGAHVEYSQGSVARVSFLPKSPFGDKHVPLLTKLPTLDTLRLEDTQVTEEGLSDLHQLRHLLHLSLRVDQLSKEREREMLAQMPYLTIEKLHIFGGRKVGDGYQ